MNKPLRILHVVNCMDTGGAETFIMNIYRNIDRNLVQFDFVVHGEEEGIYKEAIKEFGGRIFHAPKFSKYHLLRYKNWWVKFFLTHRDYRVVHSHVRTTTPILFYAARRQKVITISHSHSTSNGHKFRQKLKGISNYFTRILSDYMIGCSDQAGRWLFGKRGIQSKNYYTLNNGIDVNKFHFDLTVRSRIRTELNVTDAFLIGHVGRFAAVKNQEYLIEIFPEILKVVPKAKLLFIGEGSLINQMKLLVNEKGLQDFIVFLDKSLNIEDYMMAMDLFLLPSLHEGIPLVLIESQATGLRSIVSNNVSRQVDLTGLVSFCDIANKQQWIEKIRNVSTSHYLRSSQKLQIQKQRYDIKSTTDTLQNLYLRLFLKGEQRSDRYEL
ncbi:glycosyltransferase [Enterococcus raffinosus]|uniref:Glycosyltransferase n=1 Tax=Enterococcus raffinosus TaxID=71452 RepID=A0AAW8T7A3_9ENTE|nr:glycosyltransferase [Enterococcus raffinosus]MDT2522031.1 glycosyltransferase [Enterococcus raffinosus]MDT2528375.1 glycosyltransferase [Enterococcus raffinosus]MDT2533159.1 glycosyltransferase [Enterococcus raffinosus]MDT2543599.1 glycosyltransferase [Enterococcus raffinosus]MDT2553713.1 glycosyltransferase [Enterococcus raffinosus]